MFGALRLYNYRLWASADLVSTTDGLIYHFHFDGKLPNGKMSIAQAVGHKPLSDADYKKSIEAAKMPKP